MHIQEQWEQDVKNYGDNAYLMWEYKGIGRKLSIYPEYETIDCPNEANWLMETYFIACSGISFAVRRRQSAELPFDLERAKNGEAIECLSITRGYKLTVCMLQRLMSATYMRFLLMM